MFNFAKIPMLEQATAKHGAYSRSASAAEIAQQVTTTAGFASGRAEPGEEQCPYSQL